MVVLDAFFDLGDLFLTLGGFRRTGEQLCETAFFFSFSISNSLGDRLILDLIDTGFALEARSVLRSVYEDMVLLSS